MGVGWLSLKMLILEIGERSEPILKASAVVKRR